MQNYYILKKTKNIRNKWMSERTVKMNNYLYLRTTMEHQRVNIDSSLTSFIIFNFALSQIYAIN
ncbi:hypothetical protein HERIO_2084 [Hepatospora eriocheir]|uniref:Uncharacterized protein n=1 Tax=Hepatospora eriocheir TaxID=1081669 RepID=A0A1X0Q8B4_9MICR|nr:hypothetical protein HERIO_2084 [Hepatospora eriocheir]